MMFGPNGPTAGDFHISYWRRQPLFVKGGGRYFTQLDFEPSRFEAIANALMKRAPQDVITSGDGVFFLQNVDRVDDELANISRRFSNSYGWNNCWFDAVKASSTSAGGIGSHYDCSDNFVIQQSGIKEWRLCMPGRMMDEEHRLRMLGSEHVGNSVMETNAIVYTLEPGDLLYIPIFWPHWGVTRSDSLSLSLVCNSTNLNRNLLPLLTSVLSGIEEWWRPLPIHLTDDVCTRETFDTAWAAFENPSLKENIYRNWVKLNSADSIKSIDKDNVFQAKIDSSDDDLTYSPPCALDSQFLFAALGYPGHSIPIDASSKLLSHNATSLIAELTRVILLLCESFVGESIAAALRKLIKAIQDHEAIVGPILVGMGEVRLWLWRINEAIYFFHQSRINQLVSYFPPLVVPELMASGWRPSHWSIPTAVIDNGINYRELRFSISSNISKEDSILMCVDGNALTLRCQGQLLLELGCQQDTWSVRKGIKQSWNYLPKYSVFFTSYNNAFLNTFLPITSQGSDMSSSEIPEIIDAIRLLIDTWPTLCRSVTRKKRILTFHPTCQDAPADIESFARTGIIIIFRWTISRPLDTAVNIVGQLAHEWILYHLQSIGGRDDIRYRPAFGVKENRASIVNGFISAVQSQFCDRIGIPEDARPTSGRGITSNADLGIALSRIADGTFDPFQNQI